MIQRRPLAMKIHQERWLISYADFITLLFAFFVVMYSVSQGNEGKYKDLALALQQAFAIQGVPLSESENIESQSSSAPSELNVDSVLEQLEKYIAEAPIGQSIQFSGNEEWIEIDIDSNLLFSSGQAALNTEAQSFFTMLATMFSPFDSAITVSGHTDNIPIANTRFANNWALSSARAVSVVELLASNGVAPRRLSAIGFGEYQPIADNTSDRGRALNRRVVLRVERQNMPAEKKPLGSLLPPVETAPSPPLEQPLLPSSVQPEANQESLPAVEPIKLRSGGLLFTRDADSPRANQK